MISDDPGPSQIICIIFFLGEIIMKEKREFWGVICNCQPLFQSTDVIRDSNVIVKL